MSEIPRQSLNKMTWGHFIDLLASMHGVTREELPIPFPPFIGECLVRRTEAGELFYAPLPKSFFMNQVVGLLVIESYCNRLGVPMRFPGWPLII